MTSRAVEKRPTVERGVWKLDTFVFRSEGLSSRGPANDLWRGRGDLVVNYDKNRDCFVTAFLAMTSVRTWHALCLSDVV